MVSLLITAQRILERQIYSMNALQSLNMDRVKALCASDVMIPTVTVPCQSLEVDQPVSLAIKEYYNPRTWRPQSSQQIIGVAYGIRDGIQQS